MTAKERSAEDPTKGQLGNKMFRLTPLAARAFDILKAEQGPRSGPRLIAEAIDLLLEKYGKEPIGSPPRPHGSPRLRGRNAPRNPQS